MPEERPRLSRRQLLRLGLALPAPLLVAACSDDPEPGGARSATEKTAAAPTTAAGALAPTPACDDGDEPTPQETEGPYFSPGSPERSGLLEAGVVGTPLTVTGTVVDTGCRPVAKALLDFWQADGDGNYDNDGYRLRGHQFTDAAGRFRLETVVPGLYPGRTRHIHVKVQAPSQPVLTTQLYLPDEPSNSSDQLFMPELLLAVRGASGTFRFVLDV
jgi:protocatechuate 3,4-dioxygenase beta subunit